MLFNSFTFVIFFIVVLFLYNLPLPWKVKKFNLLWASYLFYAAWNPPFIILLWTSTVVDWLIARQIYRTQSTSRRRALLAVTLIVNLGFLGFFKYSGFLVSSFITAANGFGIHYQPVDLGIILPIGISFYTFETISYVVDVYWGKIKPAESLLDYALFISFFPHLVAGPIVRPELFLPQCESARRVTRAQFGWGLSLLVLGLFEKVVIADGLLAPIADSLYSRIGSPDFVAAWAGTLAFAGQVFCDFAGYSTSALGVALCFGFYLPVNFRFPYASIGFSDFWLRWHISLSSWLRDYLYIPLGGNRKGRARTQANLMLTMLIGGLWHGAAWTFVGWGGLHGLYLVIERVLKRRLGHLTVWDKGPVRLALGLLTFALVCITWVFFRAVSFRQAFVITQAMLGLGSATTQIHLQSAAILTSIIVVLGIVAIHWTLRDTTLEAIIERSPQWTHAVVLAAMLIAIITMPGADRAFIYFQF